jgi:8-oxo-dGTP pyrophosphatase MutT (NUDIX family)
MPHGTACALATRRPEPMLRDDQLRATLSRELTRFVARPPAPEDAAAPRRAAAVALAIGDAGFGADLPGMPVFTDWQRSAAMLLTRRAAGMRNHPGQWALPGGRQDEGESPEQAALRELSEEIGLELEPDAVLGRLDDFETRSGFVITPVVVWAGTAQALAPSASEVASVHRIPLTEFLRPDAPLLEQEPGVPGTVLRMPVGDTWIAAPTAAMLYQFREVCLLGRHTRVAHFEQPRFAWR